METSSADTNDRTQRVQVRFSEADLRRLRQLAGERDLALTALVRSLTRSAMAGEAATRLDQLEVVSVAALMAAEHCLRLVEAVFPGAARRSDQISKAARLSALERIEEVRGELEEARPA